MEYLIAAIITWLSINYPLEYTGEYPDITFAPASQITDHWVSRTGALLFVDADLNTDGNLPSARDSDLLTKDGKVVAFYDEPGRTIYLTDEWRADSPAHTSVLVHELVHHLQHLQGKAYRCPAAREQLAYRAQQDWLSMFDTTLEAEFEIDAMTLLVRTRCLF
ncbi:MAG: hypothetical protein M5U09_27730 [Gammaproteobacteria bacterium]|nr:hypothetical protein [Gammaproteobacteria bacterium]